MIDGMKFHNERFLPVPEMPQAPYRGIEAFRFIDQPIFCAREQETHKLVRQITIYRGVLLYGASGSGKSSLINAGLIPALLQDGLVSERIRVQPRRGEELIVERIPMTRDGGPPYLPSIFAEREGDVRGESVAEARLVLSAASFRERLRQRASTQPVLLIFDQFEEIVTLFEEVPQIQSREEAREVQETILAVLVELQQDHSLPVKLLISFREDYLASLRMHFRRCPDLTDQYLRLTSPDRAALLDIVRGPFRSEAAREHFGRELTEEVAQELAIEIEKRSEGELLNLSEIEIVCDRLWRSDDPAQILRQRRVRGLLEDFLSEELSRLQDLCDPAIALLSRMVTEGGTRNVITDADLLSQVHKDEKLPEKRLQLALEALEKQTRLVRRERRNNVYFYEIVSEFLVPWIVRKKAERKSARRQHVFRRRVAGVAAVISLVSVAAMVWNYQNVTRDREVQRLKGELAISKKESYGRSKRINGLLAHINGLRSKVVELEIDQRSKQGAIDGFRSRIAELERDQRRYQVTIGEFETDQRRQLATNENLTGRLNDLLTDKRNSQVTVDNLRRRVAELETDQRSKQVVIGGLNGRVNELVADQRGNQATIGDLRRKVGELESEQRSKQAVIDGLNGRIDELIADQRSKQTAIEALNGTVTATRSIASICQDARARLEREKKQTDKARTRAEEELRQCLARESSEEVEVMVDAVSHRSDRFWPVLFIR